MIDWGKISTSDTFEALCGALLTFEDPDVDVYRRPGKDSAIDAQSSTKNIVYQFKFHKTSDPDSFIKDAKSEFAQIKKYLDEGKANAKLWSPIKKWILLTNTLSNANQASNNWEDIEKLFSKIGIVPELWAGEKLEQLIRKHTPVYNEFFKQEVRPYLTLGEAEALLNKNAFRKDEYKSNYFGRKKELSEVDSFFKGNKKVLVVHGSGGTGKTRFLLESGNRASGILPGQVYWANTATLESDKSFMGGIVPEKNHVILIDEPEDIRFLRVLFEQLDSPTSRIQGWKVIISVRSQNPRVLDAIRETGPRAILNEIELEPIEPKSFENLIDDQMAGIAVSLPAQDKKDLKSKLINLSGGHPIWVHIALRLVEEGESVSSVPEDQFGVARKYVSQTLKNTPEEVGKPGQINELAKWSAIYGEISLRDSNILGFLCKELSLEKEYLLQVQIDYLLKVNLAKRFGTLVKIKPDVIRDHLVLGAFITDLSQKPVEISSFGKYVQSLLQKSGSLPNLPRILKTLTFVDLYSKFNLNEIKVLGGFTSGLISTAKTADSSQRVEILELADHLAVSDPGAIVELANTIISTPSETKTVTFEGFGDLGKHTVDQTEVLRKLPDLLQDASRYAIDKSVRKSICELLTELLSQEVLDENDSTRHRHNDGKRAKNAIEHLINGGPGFLIHYAEEFESIITTELNAGSFDKNPLFYKYLVSPLISLRRGHSEFNKGAITISRYFLNPKSKAYASRLKVIESIWTLINENSPQNNRVILFNLIDEAHRDLHNALADSGIKEFGKEERANLERLEKLISSDWVTITDLREARSIWDWHYLYDKRTDIKEIATRCENIYLSKPNSKVFHDIYQWKYEQEEGNKEEIDRYCSSLLAKTDGTIINEAVIEGLEFAGDQKFWHGAQVIIEFLLKNFDTDPVQRFLHREFTSSDSNFKHLARLLVSHRAAIIRREEISVDALSLVQKWANETTGDSDKVNFLGYCYNGPNLAWIGEQSKEEFDYLLNSQKLFENQEEPIKFVQAITNSFYTDEQKFKASIDKLLPKLGPKDAGGSVAVIIDTLHMLTSLKDRIQNVEVSKDLVVWAFEKLREIPSYDHIKGNVDYDLGELLKYVGWTPNLKDFEDFINFRIKKAGDFEKDQFEVMPGISFDIIKFFKKWPDPDIENSEAAEVFGRLVVLNKQPYPVGYNIHEWIQKFDPSGEMVPDIVYQKIKALPKNTDLDDVYLWARYSGTYHEGTPSWRKIAKGLAEQFGHITGDDRKRLLWFLARHDQEGWSGTYGEFHPRWQDEVDHQNENAEQEQDPFIKEFFQLKKGAAVSDLDREKVRFEEEHGDE